MKLSKLWSRSAASMILLAMFGMVAIQVASPDTTLAFCDTTNLSISSGAQCAQGTDQPAELFGDGAIFQRVTNILLFLIGAIAVIMLIIGGIRYVISGGDQGQVTAAKNTILYAIIGIVVAFLAYAAVDFVTTQLLEGSNSAQAFTSRLV